VSDPDVDPAFEVAAHRAPEAQVTDAIADSLGMQIQPARGVRLAWRALTLLCTAALVALITAVATGLDGVHAQSAGSAALLLLTLALLGWISARALVRQLTPGSLYRIRPAILCASAVASLAAFYLTLFHGHGTEHFLSAGFRCLATGLLVATPTSALIGLLVRHGLASQGVGVGLAMGTLSGLTGIGMLTLHCPNLQLPHLFWHALVLVVSAVVGAGAGVLFVPGPARTSP
jgi:hypothetical protein